MILRFWKLSIRFIRYPLEQYGWGFGVTYFDGGLHFTLFKYEMALDWGYFESEWYWGKCLDD